MTRTSKYGTYALGGIGAVHVCTSSSGWRKYLQKNCFTAWKLVWLDIGFINITHTLLKLIYGLIICSIQSATSWAEYLSDKQFLTSFRLQIVATL